MAWASLKLAVLLLLLSAAVPSVLSDSEALAPGPDCSKLILAMEDCLSFVSNGSTLAKPQGNCCGGFLTVVETNPWCLCEGYHNSAKLGVSLDDAKAKALPPLCKIPSYIIPNCDAPPPAVGPGTNTNASTSSVSPIIEVADAAAPSTPTVADATPSTPTLAVTPPPAAPAPAPAQGTSAASSLVALSSSAISVAAAATASWFLI